MILAHNEIRHALDSGAWTAHRDGKRIGSELLTINPCSVNCSLGNIALECASDYPIDLHDEGSTKWESFEFEKLCVHPDEFYLLHVRERFDCSAPILIHGRECYFAPMIEGRSTPARCSLSIHETAGFSEYGFDANFTLEVSARLPVIIRPGDEIAQIYFQEVSSPTRYDSVYADQYDAPRSPVLGKERFRRFA